jgi:hypothetical protein
MPSNLHLVPVSENFYELENESPLRLAITYKLIQPYVSSAAAQFETYVPESI